MPYYLHNIHLLPTYGCFPLLVQGPILLLLRPPLAFTGNTVGKRSLKGCTILCLAATVHVAH